MSCFFLKTRQWLFCGFSWQLRSGFWHCPSVKKVWLRFIPDWKLFLACVVIFVTLVQASGHSFHSLFPARSLAQQLLFCKYPQNISWWEFSLVPGRLWFFCLSLLVSIPSKLCLLGLALQEFHNGKFRHSLFPYTSIKRSIGLSLTSCRHYSGKYLVNGSPRAKWERWWSTLSGSLPWHGKLPLRFLLGSEKLHTYHIYHSFPQDPVCIRCQWNHVHHSKRPTAPCRVGQANPSFCHHQWHEGNCGMHYLRRIVVKFYLGGQSVNYCNLFTTYLHALFLTRTEDNWILAYTQPILFAIWMWFNN